MNRGFYQHTKSRYAKTLPLEDDQTEEIMFGMYGETGGTTGEMAMVWYDGQKFMEDKPVARLECYDDAFKVLYQFVDVIHAVGNIKNIQPDQFVSLLIKHGFEDRTSV